jgi:hypothetical protein
MLPVLLAVRSSWIAVLCVILGILVLWFVGRVFVDLFAWVRDEFFDEYRELRESSQEKRKAKGQNEEESD